MNVIKPLLAALAISGLVGCSEAGGSGLLSRAAGLVLGEDDAPTRAQPVSVPEEELLGNPGKYMRVNIRDMGIWDTLVAGGENGARTTWLGASGVGVTVESGVVVATRGLPRDLMGADASQTVQAIRAGGGTATRVHDFLSNQDEITQFTMQCEITSKGADDVSRMGQTIAATRYEELCRSDGLTLTNVYWVDRTRRIVRSLQAVSPDAGYLQIDVF